mgnify:CR=1 FL=1
MKPKDDLKLYIITPSICRNALVRTCKSVHSQTYKNWEHIILFDEVENDKINNFLEKIPYKPTIERKSWKNFGNGQRHDAWNLVPEDSLITYMDDDDYYKDSDCFNKIINKFQNSNIDVVFWAGIRYGEFFNHKPPRANHTMSNQFAHYKYDSNNNPIQWDFCPNRNQSPGRDAMFIDRIVKSFNYSHIDDPLVVVEKSNRGL